MAYAEEREYTRVEAAVLVNNYIIEHRSITIEDAMRITGGTYHQCRNLLIDLDRLLGTYYEREERGVLRRRLVEDDAG